MKEIICITCPRGCHLQVDENNGFAVTGNHCPRGAEYGKNEVTHPVRTLTSTVKIEGASLRRCPVRSKLPLPKEKIFEAAKLLNGVTLRAPVKIGDVAVKNILNTGVDIIVTRDL